MSIFTEAEIEYLQGHRLGRLATVNERGEPHVVPARYRYNPETETIDVGGRDMGKSKKYRDAARTGRVAFLVDDTDPSSGVRGLEVRGTAQVMTEGGESIARGTDAEFIRIAPTHIAAWGIDAEISGSNSRDV